MNQNQKYQEINNENNYFNETPCTCVQCRMGLKYCMFKKNNNQNSVQSTNLKEDPQQNQIDQNSGQSTILKQDSSNQNQQSLPNKSNENTNTQQIFHRKQSDDSQKGIQVSTNNEYSQKQEQSFFDQNDNPILPPPNNIQSCAQRINQNDCLTSPPPENSQSLNSISQRNNADQQPNNKLIFSNERCNQIKSKKKYPSMGKKNNIKYIMNKMICNFRRFMDMEKYYNDLCSQHGLPPDDTETTFYGYQDEMSKNFLWEQWSGNSKQNIVFRMLSYYYLHKKAIIGILDGEMKNKIWYLETLNLLKKSVINPKLLEQKRRKKRNLPK